LGIYRGKIGRDVNPNVPFGEGGDLSLSLESIGGRGDNRILNVEEKRVGGSYEKDIFYLYGFRF
jgi:hypothetical protein